MVPIPTLPFTIKLFKTVWFVLTRVPVQIFDELILLNKLDILEFILFIDVFVLFKSVLSELVFNWIFVVVKLLVLKSWVNKCPDEWNCNSPPPANSGVILKPEPDVIL